MALSAVQNAIAHQYLPSSMNNALSIPEAGGYRDMTSSVLSDDRPLALSRATMGSFGAGTSWRSKHIGLKGLQAGNIGSTINFSTNQVDPNVR